LAPKWQYLKNASSIKKIEIALQASHPNISIEINIKIASTQTPHESKLAKKEAALDHAKLQFQSCRAFNQLLNSLNINFDQVEFSLPKQTTATNS
jgi:hypothetical protein